MMYASSCVCVCIHDGHHTYTPMRPYPVAYPPIHIGTYTYVCTEPYTAWGTYPPCTHTYIPPCTYPCVYTRYLYYPPMRMGPCAWASTRGYLCGACCGGPRLLSRRVASPSPVLRVGAARSAARAQGLALPPHPCHHMGMDTSATPLISPTLEAETKAALMLRYVEDREDVAYLYAQSLVNFFTIDLDIPEALQLTRDIITESTNDIRNFEGEEVASRIDVALRRLIDRVEAELVD